MAYEKLVSQQFPGWIIFILDDSGSMTDALPGTSDPRYQWVERYIGIILDQLLERSSELRGNDVVIKPRYFVDVIKYGGNVQRWGQQTMDIEETIKQFTNAGNTIELGGHLGGTDAKSAFEQAQRLISKGITNERFRNSFPPMVFHLTDGESWTDASPIADQIKQLSTSDGNVLVVNGYIGTQTSLKYQGPDDFPGYLDETEAGPGDDNIRLFQMSSKIPSCIEEYLKTQDIFPQLRSNVRLFFDVRTKEMLKHVIQVIGSLGSKMAR
ncbi:vWA domain-containing protein [Planctomycetota bacterium]